MQHYTLGFIFNSTLDKVLLMHKLKPEWQKGKLNGVGGKMEAGEDEMSCIVREVGEETSLSTSAEEWHYLGDLHGKEWRVAVLALIWHGPLTTVQSLEAEPVAWHTISQLPDNAISNLSWLIPFALDKIRNKQVERFKVGYLS